MTVTLTLYIVGLVGLVGFPFGHAHGMDVYLMKTHDGMPNHVASLRVQEGVPSEADTGLENYAVTVECGTPVKGKAAQGVTIKKDDPTLPWSSMKWVSTISPLKGAKLRTDLMQGGEGRVTAGLKLIDGTLEAAPPEERLYDSVVWKIGTKKQALTDRVQYTLQCPGESIVFRFYPFNGAPPRKPLTVTGKDGNVVAVVSNLPQSSNRPLHPSTDLKMPHFAAAYQLFDMRAGEEYSGVPQMSRLAHPTATGDDPIHCVPVFVINLPLPPPPPPPDCSAMNAYSCGSALPKQNIGVAGVSKPSR